MEPADNRPTHVRQDIYKESGVDTAEADTGLQNIVRRVQGTWPRHGMGRVVLPIGYFANVIEMDGTGIAICTDCVAMNVNDMICVGAKPLSLVDYIAIQQADAAMLDAVAVGLCEGAKM